MRTRMAMTTRTGAFVLPLVVLIACSDDAASPTEPAGPAFSASKPEMLQLAQQIRELSHHLDIPGMPAPPPVRDGLADLGKMLLFDRVLSGNRDISCMTCHLPRLATGDARSLAIGQGASGLGDARVHPSGEFIPRNAPPLFNLHLLKHLFWDGRVAVDEAGTFRTPAGASLTGAMTAVFEFGAVSAIGLFPVLSREEMRGAAGENELGDIADSDMTAIWAAVMQRLGAIPRYRQLFETAYPGTRFDEMTFAHASNAMAGFLLRSFVFDNTPWDRFLAGNNQALSLEQLEGALKFMNAPCAQCHNGAGFSDDDFHNVALAQFGPGHRNGPTGRDDFGRMNVTGDPADIYRFRSTMLRNVELTGPYGHAGEFVDLAAFIDHYSRSADKLRAYTAADVPEPLLRATLLEDNKEAIIAARDPLILPVAFDSIFTRQVTAFMLALTDDRARDLSRFSPTKVPSGLPVDR
jgi:cytochrome c peroxidase